MRDETRKEHSMTDIAPTASAILGLPAPAQATGAAIREMVDDLSDRGKMAILAPDGMGDFAWRQWREHMPYLASLHGDRSILLRSIMPSITPVNFACMVTGADLSVHGVNAKTETFKCETLFDVIRREGGKSAGIGLEGYTGSDLLGRHADIWGNAGDGSDDDVMQKVIEIVDRDAPRFLIAQLGRVDDAFHKHGPSSSLVVPMLRETDARLRKLVDHLKPLGHAVIILSDHGQHDLPDATQGQKKGGHGTDCPEDCLVPCTWV